MSEIAGLYGKYKFNYAAAAAKSLQLCPTLCDPRDGSPPGSPVPGILQARALEWAAIASSSALRNCHIVLHNSFTIVQSHCLHVRAPSVLRPRQPSAVSVLFSAALIDVWFYHIEIFFFLNGH